MDITTSQTIGPFSHEAWRWACDATAGVDSDAPTVTVSGIIRDGDGLPINDAMIEAWLPAAAVTAAEARHVLPGFRRVASGEDGGYTLVLSRPAARAVGEPAALITVFARGLVKHQFTAIFLADDAGMEDSPLLRQVPAERRATLVAQRNSNSRDNSGDYRWDIAMQGADETVFFDYV